MAGRNFITKDVKMDSSRTRKALFVYWLGIALPVLMVAALTLLERAGAKSSLGVAWIALVSLAVCVVGVVIARTTTKRTVALLVLAVILIPVELLVLAVVSLMHSGLAGTQ